jgi:hypothetical protein
MLPARRVAVGLGLAKEFIVWNRKMIFRDLDTLQQPL